MTKPKSLSQLSTEDFLKILDGYFAPNQKRSRLMPEEIQALAIRFNERINVPLISETLEEVILFKVILKIDVFLYDHLPNELYDMIRSADQGLTESESKSILKRLISVANKKIDIPYLPEIIEHFVIRFVITVILKAMSKTWTLDLAIEKSDDLVNDDSEVSQVRRKKLGRR